MIRRSYSLRVGRYNNTRPIYFSKDLKVSSGVLVLFQFHSRAAVQKQGKGIHHIASAPLRPVRRISHTPLSCKYARRRKRVFSAGLLQVVPTVRQKTLRIPDSIMSCRGHCLWLKIRVKLMREQLRTCLWDTVKWPMNFFCL